MTTLAAINALERRYEGPFSLPRSVADEIAAAEQEAAWLERLNRSNDPVIARTIAKLRASAAEMKERAGGR